jgi:hypothetical protein
MPALCIEPAPSHHRDDIAAVMNGSWRDSTPHHGRLKL